MNTSATRRSEKLQWKRRVTPCPSIISHAVQEGQRWKEVPSAPLITSACCSGARGATKSLLPQRLCELNGGLPGTRSLCPPLREDLPRPQVLPAPPPSPWLRQKPGGDTSPAPRRPASRTGHARHRPAPTPVGGKRRTPRRAAQPASLLGTRGGCWPAAGAVGRRVQSAAKRQLADWPWLGAHGGHLSGAEASGQQGRPESRGGGARVAGSPAPGGRSNRGCGCRRGTFPGA